MFSDMNADKINERQKDMDMCVRLGCVFALIVGTIAVDFVPGLPTVNLASLSVLAPGP